MLQPHEELLGSGRLRFSLIKVEALLQHPAYAEEAITLPDEHPRLYRPHLLRIKCNLSPSVRNVKQESTQTLTVKNNEAYVRERQNQTHPLIASPCKVLMIFSFAN